MSYEKVAPQVIIDLMNNTDLPDILDIERESFPSPWTEGMFTRELGSTHSVCLAARMNVEENSVIVAYIIFWLVADEVHLHNLAVNR